MKDVYYVAVIAKLGKPIATRLLGSTEEKLRSDALKRQRRIADVIRLIIELYYK